MIQTVCRFLKVKPIFFKLYHRTISLNTLCLSSLDSVLGQMRATGDANLAHYSRTLAQVKRLVVLGALLDFFWILSNYKVH